MIIGEIKEIIRYPVKSFYGEKVNRTSVQSYGLYGDRSHAFLDETRPGKFLTLTQMPAMTRYRAMFVGEETMERFPELKICSPSGNIYYWGDGRLLDELESFTNKQLTPIQYTPNYVPLGAIEEEHLLLTTDASLEKLEELWGEQVDNLRFRPNILISLYDKSPFIEEEWFGKRVLLGDVEIEMKRHCERCTIINIDPENGITDLSLLKTVYQKRNNHFGVYASVIKTGEINVGDKITLID
ncbi:MOSC domain-containing protein [Cytobacillus sp. Hz8]|uniref:MOSC domain-containing protein n=1 Tax=Cytobacillus sp. Hz8 TaxID=3347168 RepID=UPI0035DA846D